MLTEFGKVVRKLRIDRGELLKNMSDKLGFTSSYLSAIEHGKKAIPNDFVNKLQNLYDLTNTELDDLYAAIEENREDIEISLKGKNEDMKNLANSFARKFNGLNSNQVSRLMNILREDD